MPLKRIANFMRNWRLVMFLCALLLPVVFQVVALTLGRWLSYNPDIFTKISGQLDWFTWSSLERIKSVKSQTDYEAMRFLVFISLTTQFLTSVASAIVILLLIPKDRRSINFFKYFSVKSWVGSIFTIGAVLGIIFWLPGIYFSTTIYFPLSTAPMGLVVLGILSIGVGFFSLLFFVIMFSPVLKVVNLFGGKSDD